MMNLFLTGTDTGVGETHTEVQQNRLGCPNHTTLTIRSVAEHGLACVGFVLK